MPRCTGRRRCSRPRRRGSTRCRRRARSRAMPIALKDNIVTIEAPTTCGSRILEGYVSPYDATAVRAPPERGRHDGRQGEHGRVRHGLVHGALRLRPGEASAGPEPGARGLLRRLGRAGGRGRGAGGARLRDRRLGAPAGELLRRGGSQAELWSGEPVRPGGVRLLARLHLGVRPHRRGRGAGAERDERPRPARQHHARPSADGGAGRRCRISRVSASGCRASTSRPTSTRAWRRAWSAPSRPSASSAPSWWRCRFPTRSTRCRPTTSWRRPRRRPTSPATTACATAPRKVGPGGDIRALYQATRGRGLRPRGPAPDPGGHLRAERRATTTPTIGRRSGSGRGSRTTSGAPSPAGSTCCSRRPRPPRPSGRARRPKTRSRCTWPTSSSAPSAWPACRR